MCLRGGAFIVPSASVMIFIFNFIFMGLTLLCAMRMVFEFHLHDLQCRGVELDFDVPAGGIPADDLVAAVIDPDPAKLPSLLGGKPDDGGAGLPLGHRHLAILFGMRGGGAKHPKKQEPC